MKKKANKSRILAAQTSTTPFSPRNYKTVSVNLNTAVSCARESYFETSRTTLTPAILKIQRSRRKRSNTTKTSYSFKIRGEREREEREERRRSAAASNALKHLIASQIHRYVLIKLVHFYLSFAPSRITLSSLQTPPLKTLIAFPRFPLV